ncbi:PQQ-binding-like beta-propeller repeat protein [bacterium]|nr:PQQ-binding-like beta-propeller repeat protein [bacterium]
MLSVISEYIKLHRHELGQTALFVGSGVVIPPLEQRLEDLLQTMALDWSGHRLDALPPERRGLEALELFAREVPDHTERCNMLRQRLADARPSEGHIRLARLIKDGYFPTIFLAEPDRLLEQCLAVNHMEPEKDYHHFVAGPDDGETIAVGVRDSARVVLVKCAGDVESKFLPLSRAEVQDSYARVAQVLQETFKVFSIFSAYVERDEPVLRYISREGGKIFWINRFVPMRDERLFDELKIENPASVEYHRFQPEVMALLEARHSARHLLCREAGTFNEFFGKMHGRLIRRTQRPATRRRKDLAVLRGGPYRFLDYFDVTDEDFFFGREDDVDALLEMLRQHPVSVLFGHSGIGKTSLLRAGLMTALQHEAEQAETPAETWLPVTASCHDDPAASIREAVAAAVEEIGFNSGDLPARGTLAPYLQAAAALVNRRLAIFLDHFEEYFVHLGPRVQEAFLDELSRCLGELTNVHWVIAIRENYVGSLYELQGKLPEIMHHVYRLHRLTREQAEDAITKPAQNFDIRMERSLTEALLDDLYRDGIEPAELQIVCDRVYGAKPRGMHTVTMGIYQRLGGAQKILSDFLDHILGQLPPGDRRLARNILKLMVTSSEVRVTRTLERIASDLSENRDEVERVLARLVDLRLVRGVGKERHRQYELIHEYLSDEISQWLSRREMRVQDVQDLLTRQLNNYEKFGILMHADELRIISEAREALSISPEELELILRSAAVEQSEQDYWFGRLSELGERQVPLLQGLLEDSRPEIRLTAVRAAASSPNREYIPQLVLLLDDENEAVQSEATATLQGLERELLAELRRGPESARALAARAIGRLKLRRGLRHLYSVIEDGDQALRDETTEAFVELSEPRAHEPLLRRLTGPQGLPWAGAYALGHLAAQDEVLQALENAQKSFPELPKVRYALGLAAMQRRDYDEAAAHFQAALELSRTELGHQTVGAALEDVETQRRRSALAVSSWPMFHRGPDHRGATETELRPPLRLLWNFGTKGPIMGAPAVADGIVFVGSRDGNLYALDAKRGTENWHLRTGDRIESTPAVAGSAVFIGSHDGRVYAAARDSGRRLWQRDVGSPIRSSATLVGGRLFIGDRQGQVVALRAETGELLWQVQTGAEVSAAPACSDGAVVVGSWDGRLYAFAADSGTKLWERLTEGPVASSAALDNGVVYCGSDDGHLYAVSEKDGQVYWRVKLGSQVRSSPAVANGRVVVGCVDGRIACLSAADGDPVWSAQSAEEVLGSPAITGSVVYIGSKDGALYAFDLNTGEQLWRHQTAYGVYSSPAVADGILYVGLDYYNLAAMVPVD